MNEWYQDPENGQETPTSPDPEAPQSEPTPAPSWQSPQSEPTPAPSWQSPQSDPAPAPSWQSPQSEPTPAPSWQSPQSEPQPQPRAPYTPPYGSPRAPQYTCNGYAPVPPTPQPPKKSGGSRVAIALLAVLCCVSLLLTSVLAIKLFTMDDDTPDSKPSASQQQPSADHEDEDQTVNENGPTLQITDAEAINDGGLATSEIVKRNVDATVVLTMYTKTSNSFYGYYYGEESDSLTEAGGASGIVMSADGYIITNSHCVYDEETQTKYDRIDVTMYDGRVFEGAKIVGFDPTTDLAVIKVDATDLTPAQFGDSSALSLGDRVVTLGNSGGLAWTVSQGILSGQARDVYEDTGYAIKCLQVDAIINPGSSGGPLINAYGQVVGVNSAKIVMSGYEGLGFSIPINEAKAVIDDLIKYGYVTGRVSLGIMGRTITSIGYEGFMIESIGEESALVGTKAKAGDIITHVNGKRVTDYAEMRAELTSHKVGESVTLTLLRLDRQTRTTIDFDVTVTLQESR